jgi:1-deoxy-D-xylulose-5-phosphate reductoisomerase
LSWPQRYHCSFGQLDLVQARALTFEAPDTEAFPALKLAIDCGKAGGTYPCAFNAGNEACVQAFLQGIIGYSDIPVLLARIIEEHQSISSPSLDEIMTTDRDVRKRASQLWKAL